MNTSTTLFLTTLVSLAPLCAQNDTIMRKSGKHLTKVKITKLERDKISYTKGGSAGSIETLITTGYRFGNAPDAYNSGLSASRRGAHAAAAKLFVDAAKVAKNDAVKSAAAFYAGRSFALASLKDPSHANNAVGQLKAYIDAGENGYYIPEAKVRLAQASLAGGDAAGAETLLTGLDNEASSNSWPLYWGALIKYTLGHAQMQQDKWVEARGTLGMVDGAVTAALGQDSKFNQELAQLRSEALVQQGETFIGQKAYAEALTYYNGLTNSTAKGVKAAAKAGQGQILYIQGKDGNDKNKLRQAQLALAEACIEPDTSDSTSAKALYYTGMVLNALGDAEENALGRAKPYFQSVKNNYPTTSWAALARKELEG